MGSQATHIPLPQRKALCGRLVFFEGAYPHHLAFLRDDAESGFISLRNKLLTTTTQAIETPRNDQRLDDFLKEKLVADLEGEAATMDRRYRHLTNPVLELVRQGTTAISCHQCAGSSERVCCGQSTDDEIVASGGQCIASIRKMFDIAILVAREYYTAYATRLPQANLPKVIFSTEFCTSKPHDIPADIFVSGATYYGRAEDSPVSEVRVRFCIEKFDWDTYLATLYVLFHECISHVFQGIASTSLPRVETGPDDAFSEGWMDWVAHEILVRILQGIDSLPATAPAIRFPDRHHEVTRKLHAARRHYDPEPRSKHAFCYAEGSSAAEKFYAFLKRITNSDAERFVALLQVSFDLNIQQSSSVRRTFVTALQTQLAEDDQLEQPRNFVFLSKLVEVTRRYLKNKDIMSFVYEVVKAI